MKKFFAILVIMGIAAGALLASIGPAKLYDDSGQFTLPYAGTSTQRDAVPNGLWSIADGDLWYDTTENAWYYYEGSAWNYWTGGGGSEVVTTDAFTVTAAMSGKTLMIPDLDTNTVVTLPVEADGLNYEFWYVGGAADANDHTIDSGSDTNFFVGGVAFADIDAGDAADEIHAGVYSDGNSNSTFTINNASAGSKVNISCDGTNWYITGVIYSDTVPAFADQ